jgi:hypothetical protein
MSKKPAAALSVSLVAVKGAAAPAPDMPGRRAAPTPRVPEADARVEQAAADRAPLRAAAAREGEGGLAPLNFRVAAGFRREFKTYAARHDLKLNELLRRSFETYRRAQGD